MNMSPCDICLDEKCEGKHNCHCATCELASKCNKHLHPTIRITNKCTQECAHCCYASSPKSKIMMSVEMSEKIAKFMKANGIEGANLLGGEFFCNPDWFEILSNIVDVCKVARIVTNGDWAMSEKVKTKLAEFIDKYKKKVLFSVSKDKWHNNKHVDAAAEFLKEHGAAYNVATEEETTDASIVPVGRAMWNCVGGGYYSMVGCYCQDDKNQYAFMIDEDGIIYKCGFGIFSYASVDEYIDGGFRKRFKEYNTFFYSKFIPSCKTCSQFVYMNCSGMESKYGRHMTKLD